MPNLHIKEVYLHGNEWQKWHIWLMNLLQNKIFFFYELYLKLSIKSWLTSSEKPVYNRPIVERKKNHKWNIDVSDVSSRPAVRLNREQMENVAEVSCLSDVSHEKKTPVISRVSSRDLKLSSDVLRYQSQTSSVRSQTFRVKWSELLSIVIL